MKKGWSKAVAASLAAAAIVIGASSAYANPVINENPKGSGGYSITQTYFNFDNYGYMEGGTPMDSWKFSNDGASSHTLAFTVDTPGASGGFVLYDTSVSGTSSYVFGASGITAGSHSYSLTLNPYHSYTLYVQPTGPSAYSYRFTLS